MFWNKTVIKLNKKYNGFFMKWQMSQIRLPLVGHLTLTYLNLNFYSFLLGGVPDMQGKKFAHANGGTSDWVVVHRHRECGPPSK